MANQVPAIYDTGLESIRPAQVGDTLDPSFLAPTSSHGTFLGSCPATGPTVAPTSEGHYYWTSAIGEKWLWVYGDVAPFIIGAMYSETLNTPSTYIYPTISGEVARATFVAPRAGKIKAVVSSYWVYDVNEYANINILGLVIFPSGEKVGNVVTYRNVLITTPTDAILTAVFDTYLNIGDIVIFRLNNISSTKLHTSINETFKIYYES